MSTATFIRCKYLLFCILFGSHAFGATMEEALNPDVAWSTDGHVPWFPQAMVARDGLAARSGAITHSQASHLHAQMEGPGTLTFWWRVNSETNGDHLTFSVDLVEQGRISGFVSTWRQVTNYLGAGTHTLTWTYAKNAGTTAWDDAGWVDQVTFASGGVTPFIIKQPVGTNVIYSGRATLSVVADGTPPLSYQWWKDGVPIPEATTDTLLIDSVETADVGEYSATVSNAFGGVVSTPVRLSAHNVWAWGAGITNGFIPHVGQSRVPTGASNVFSIAASGRHSVAMNENGSVIAWGENVYGQTNVPSAATNVIAIAAGETHCLAIRSDRTVVAWGNNSYGQIKIPTDLTSVIAVAAGGQHSLALGADGRVFAWGSNNSSQGSVPGPATEGVVAIAAGASHNLVLRHDGTVIAWGLSSSGQTTIPASATNVVAVAASSYSSAALRRNGTVVVWGGNSSGERNVPSHATNVVAIAAGADHFLALRSDGTVVGWGANLYGQTNAPAVATNLMAIAAGRSHSLALADRGELSIIVPPIDQKAVLGGGAAFRATVVGGWPRTYQWQKNRVDIPGATNSWLSLTNVQSGDAASYRLVVNNAAGTRISPEALLKIAGIADALNNTNLVFEVIGEIPWSVQTTQTLDGFALASGAITYSAPSAALRTVVEGPGLLMFSWNAIGFPAFSLRLYVDGTAAIVNQFSGWQQSRRYLPPGRHVLVWSASVSAPSSLTPRAFLDQVSYIPGPTPATINSQPGNRTVAAGSNVLMSVGAFGTPSLFYQWRFNGTNLPGANGSVLTISDAQPERSGIYSVVVSNAYGIEVSSNATLTVTPSGPFFVSHPTNRQVFLGGSTSFSAGARGSNPIRYQWLREGSPIFGATNSSLLLADLQLQQNGQYSLVASNEFGTATSSNASLLVYTIEEVADAAGGDGIVWSFGTNAPWFPQTKVTHDGVVALQSGAIGYGQRSVLLGELTGPATVSFWWSTQCDSFWSQLQFGVDGGTNLAIAGNVPWTQKTVFIASGSHQLEWRQIRNTLGESQAETGWLDEVVVTPGATAALIVTNPASITASAGISVTFSVGAIGTPPLRYQWRFGDEVIPGATNSTLRVVNVQAEDAGAYSVMVSNDYGPDAESGGALLTVTPSVPVITTQPSNQVALLHSRATIQVQLRGSEPLHFQWHSTKGPIPGANDSSLIFGSVQPSDAGSYFVVITNAHGVATSAVVLLEVSPTKVVDYWGSVWSTPFPAPIGLTNIFAVAAGRSHTLGLRYDGTVVGWGTSGSAAAQVPPMLSDVTAIAAGYGHSVALRSDGTVVAWGDNYFGELDIPPSATNVIEIAAGSYHSLALRGDGTVMAWGNNNNRQADVPEGLSNVVSIAAGSYNSAALKADGTLVMWGVPGHPAPPAYLTDIAQIVTGSRTSWALNAFEDIVSWGSLWVPAPSQDWAVVGAAAGHPDSDYFASIDRAGRLSVSIGSDFPRIPYGTDPTNAVAVAASFGHMAVLLNDGTPYESRKLLNRTAPVGAQVVFSCGILGAGPMSYQWRRDGENLPDETNAWLILPSVTWTNAGTYRCVAGNHLGELESSSAVLNVVRSTPQFDPATAVKSGEGFRAHLRGLSGVGTVVIEASSNLVDWVPVFTNPPHEGTIEFVDPAAVGQEQRFYRAVEEADALRGSQ